MNPNGKERAETTIHLGRSSRDSGRSTLGGPISVGMSLHSSILNPWLSHLNIFIFGSGHIISKTDFVHHFILLTDHYCALLEPNSQCEVYSGNSYCHFPSSSLSSVTYLHSFVGTVLLEISKNFLWVKWKESVLYVALPETFDAGGHLSLSFKPPQSLASWTTCDHFSSWEVSMLSWNTLQGLAPVSRCNFLYINLGLGAYLQLSTLFM